MDRSWTLACLDDWSQVWNEGFVAHWNRLSEQSEVANVFFTPPLVKAWTDTYRKLADIEPRFLAGSDDAGNEALLPMVLFRRGWKGGWLRSLEPVGANEFDYHDPLVSGNGSSGPLRQGFWSAAVDLMRPSRPDWDVLHIPRLRLPPSAGTFPTGDAGTAPFIELSGFASFETYLSSRSSQHRQDLRRQQRRMSDLGVVSLWSQDALDRQSADRALERLASFRRSRWPNAYEAPGLLDNIVSEGLPSGTVRMAELRVGDRPVAWHLGFAHRGVFHYYMPAFDPTMASYSPGKVLLAHLIEEGMRQGFTRFDLLSGREPYKAVWQTGEVALSSVEEPQASLGATLRSAAHRTVRRLGAARRQVTLARA